MTPNVEDCLELSSTADEVGDLFRLLPDGAVVLQEFDTRCVGTVQFDGLRIQRRLTTSWRSHHDVHVGREDVICVD
jgi:hypothetical protein